MGDVMFTRHPSLAGKMDARSAIVSSSSTFLVLRASPVVPAVLFSISCDGYWLSLQIGPNSVRLARNSDAVECAFPPQRPLIIFASWGTNVLEVWANETRKSVETANTLPPRALLRWAREQTLAPEDRYRSGVHLLETIHAQFEAIGPKLQNTRALEAFWDHQYKGRRLDRKVPMKEPYITQALHGYLYDIDVTKNIQTVAEAPVGSGRMDFLMSAPLENGGTALVCVEVKLAHSPDLADGLYKQLPEYMNRKETDYGLFVVVDFGPDHPADPTLFKTLPDELKQDGLKWYLPIVASEVSGSVKSVILPAYKAESPSRL